jgi:hypothetical protein
LPLPLEKLRFFNYGVAQPTDAFGNHASTAQVGKDFARRACVGPLAFSPDGKVLASGDGFWAGRGDLGGQSEASIRLWDTTTGKELCRHRMIGSSEVHAVAFSPDGKLIASGGAGEKDSSVHLWEAATGRLIRRFEGHHSWVWAVAFAADGLTLASGAGDSTILLWDITGRRKDGKLRGAALTPRQLETCWTTLAHEDAAKAYDAVWALVAAPEQALPFLAEHLRPAPRRGTEVVARLIAELDSEDFKVRQKAVEELSKFGDVITPALQQALEDKPPLEVRRRVQQLPDRAANGRRNTYALIAPFRCSNTSARDRPKKCCKRSRRERRRLVAPTRRKRPWGG